MADKTEALDAVGASDRIATGIHVVATLTMCAKGATKDELELARRILQSDPKRDAPREAESIASAFNRTMDAAIESCNRSASEPTRAGRRARLAHDLDQADVLLVDRNYLAGLIADRISLELEQAAYNMGAVDLGAELLDGERIWTDGAGNFFTGENGTTPIARPSFYTDADGFVGDVGRDPIPDAYGNPNVND